MARKETKRKRGRPKKQRVFSAAELKAQSKQYIRLSQERRQGTFNYVEAENVISLMSDSEKVGALNKEEVLALREEAAKLWELLGYTEEYETERYKPVTNDLTDEEFLNAPALDGQMSRKEWIEAHKFLKPKRKNARLPKSIRDIRKNKYESYGLTDQKPETIDVDALEKALEDELMDRAVAEMAEAKTKRVHVGKRLRKPTPKRHHSQIDTSKFWT